MTAEWSTQQLAEFVATVSAAPTETAAASAAVERAAEALDADVAAIVCGGEVIASVGYPDGAAPAAELEAVRPTVDAATLEVPGVGSSAAAAAALEHPPGATLVIARPQVLTREETGLLRGMGRVASMTMRMLRGLDDERAAREELERLAGDQAALRRVATLVAESAPPADIHAAVAEEIAHRLEADIVAVLRYEPDGTGTILGRWSVAGLEFPTGRHRVEGRSVAVAVRGTGRPAHVEDFDGPPGSFAAHFRAMGLRVAVGSPIVVEDRLWGAAVAGSIRRAALPPGTETRIGEFTELLATAIANADARAALRRIADEQAALRRVATLIARGVAPERVFTAVAEEVGRVLPVADVTLVGRYDERRAIEVLGGWSRDGDTGFVGRRVELGGHNVATLVARLNAPARVERLPDDAAAATALARHWARSAAGAPIVVEGALWGVMTVASVRPGGLPAGIEYQLADFTELVATSIANAQAREELRSVAEEQAALRRVATLVAEPAPPSAVFAAVAAEVGRLHGADRVFVARYDPDDVVTVIAVWDAAGEFVPAFRRPGGSGTLSARVRETGRPARVDRYADHFDEDALRAGIRAAVGAPITVKGRLWGHIGVASMGDPPPPGTEERLGDFTELVATAIANAEAQAELTASRARIVASADETRRRIERDLHDGAQQRLVSLALRLRAAQQTVPHELAGLAAELDGIAGGLNSALDELREFARGIHPAILAERGLGSALRTLARRSPVPVDLDVEALGALPAHVEVATYYVISEALTNVAKHAHATSARVEVAARHEGLHIRVQDDGVGGADLARGSGLVGLRDRVEALGGRIELESRPGAGTSVSVELPLEGHGVAVRPGPAPRRDAAPPRRR